ncbi:hypothetical protein BDZ91DRAFT_844153 [Kalaharituber pfeilii]|nr:hypothetical protein BDZ91DRAFT_844153 [Kalaharituber pfeilii]
MSMPTAGTDPVKRGRGRPRKHLANAPVSGGDEVMQQQPQGKKKHSTQPRAGTLWNTATTSGIKKRENGAGSAGTPRKLRVKPLASPSTYTFNNVPTRSTKTLNLSNGFGIGNFNADANVVTGDTSTIVAKENHNVPKKSVVQNNHGQGSVGRGIGQQIEDDDDDSRVLVDAVQDDISPQKVD